MFCHLPDSGRQVTSLFQGLSLSLPGTGRRGPCEQGCNPHVSSTSSTSSYSLFTAVTCCSFLGFNFNKIIRRLYPSIQRESQPQTVSVYHVRPYLSRERVPHQLNYLTKIGDKSQSLGKKGSEGVTFHSVNTLFSSA